MSIDRSRGGEKKEKRRWKPRPEKLHEIAHKNRLLSLYRRVPLGFYVHLRDALSRA